ncbi:MAG: nucleoside-diphosphate-sugar pyrophosphorylase [Acidobacteria bacterium]|jgi:NDP-sugar pyrophosphorylase family protein|nr:nucleoside-diphosphate-sugar pyrophosphorylase [Acidobacteriota bacterium]
MQAVILAGGRGTRLHPYTTVLPKPLMPIGDHPILEIILRQLQHHGVTRVILAVGHMSHLFEAFFQDGRRFGLEVTYSFEDAALGTAGPLASILDKLDENVLVLNGDLLTTLNFNRLVAHHLEHRAAATIGTFRRHVDIDFGVLELNDEADLVRYVEKPRYTFDVSMGINVLNVDSVRAHLKPGVRMDLPTLMQLLVSEGKRVCSYREECQWLDIGRVDDYRAAVELFQANHAGFMPNSSTP